MRTFLIAISIALLFTSASGQITSPSGPAGSDATCPAITDDMCDKPQHRGIYRLGGGTAFFVNNTAHDGRLLMLTARHVLGDVSPGDVISTTLATSQCQGQKLYEVSIEVLDEYLNTDHVLVEVMDLPDSLADSVLLLGWDFREYDIPRMEMYSMGFLNSSHGGAGKMSLTRTSAGRIERTRVSMIVITEGQVGGGLSGSPIFNTEGLVLGIVSTGRYGACGHDYMIASRPLDLSYNYDRLFQFLDPGGSGERVIESLDRSLPVELVRFTATATPAGVKLAWETASETSNAGFDVEYSAIDDAVWSNDGWVAGHGTTTETQTYTHTVTVLAPGRYVFRLRQVDYDGTFEYSPEVEVSVAVVGALDLRMTSANPARDRAVFRVVVPTAQWVMIEVFDVLGRRVALLHDSSIEADEPLELSWDATNVTPGIYFVRLIGERFSHSETVIVH